MANMFVDSKHFFIVSINFLNYLYYALLSSFLFDVQILRKFHSNIMIGLCYTIDSIGSLGVFLTPLIKRKILRDLTLNIANVISCLFTYVSCFALFTRKDIILIVSLFGLSFFSSIVNKLLYFLMVGDLNKKDRDNIITANKFSIDIAYTLGNTVSFILYNIFDDGWKYLSVQYVFYIALAIYTLKCILVFVYYYIYMRKFDILPLTTIPTDKNNEVLEIKESIGNRYLPWIVTLSKIIFAIGSGLSVKFFVVYMIKRFGLRPSKISLISMMISITSAALVLFVKYIEKFTGAPLVVILAKLIGFIFIICFTLSTNLEFSLLCYMLRYPIQNCTRAIITALILSHTNKKGYRWWLTSHEFVSLINSGASFIGGIIADKYGYKTCFFITCGLYGLAQLVFLPCYFLDKK